MADEVRVQGARQHNLDNVSVSIPHRKITVMAGPSGSGKSSLAFDTIFAEGQRRYIESLGIQARRALHRLPKPDVDLIEGLMPTLCVREATPRRNPRSTVGTSSELLDHLRVLFATTGVAHCVQCDKEIVARSVAEIADDVLRGEEGRRFSVLAPLQRGERSGLNATLDRLRQDGFARVRLDGAIHDLQGLRAPGDKAAHDLDVVIDRLSVRHDARARLSEAIELATKLGDGRVLVVDADSEKAFSTQWICPDGHGGFAELTPAFFSFNTTTGACPACQGLGVRRIFTEALAVPDRERSLRRGAVAAWGKPQLAYHSAKLAELDALGVDLDRPWSALPARTRQSLLHGGPLGVGHYAGILVTLRAQAESYRQRKQAELHDDDALFDALEAHVGSYSSLQLCDACGGARLRPEALAVRLADWNLDKACSATLDELQRWLAALDPPPDKARALAPLLAGIETRLGFLQGVGLGYLSLARQSGSLSTGEAQRVQLARQLAGGLSNVLFVLDEPSAGLHPDDVGTLVDLLSQLRERGNTLLVVEHDPALIAAADALIELGPGAGEAGGKIVAAGPIDDLTADSPTLAYVRAERSVPQRQERRAGRGEIRVDHASLHNLRDVSVTIPTSTLSCVSGVSGSGKSTLVSGVIGAAARAGDTSLVRGLEAFARIVEVDSTPLGRSSKSTPITYIGAFDAVRALFASLPEARARGYSAKRFSFNTKGGRCEVCAGEGVESVSMQFLPDAEVPCTTCAGARYNAETLAVRYHGLNIAQVLALSVRDALRLFEAIPKVRTRLDTLDALGLGYMALGRHAITLSGGEAQRLRLAKHLSESTQKSTLFLLDEPTRGLHYSDIERLLVAVQRLVDRGHTVVVVEHHLDVIKNADHIIDMGPGAAAAGGRVVAQGTPEQIAVNPASRTGHHLRAVLGR